MLARRLLALARLHEDGGSISLCSSVILISAARAVQAILPELAKGQPTAVANAITLWMPVPLGRPPILLDVKSASVGRSWANSHRESDRLDFPEDEGSSRRR